MDGGIMGLSDAAEGHEGNGGVFAHFFFPHSLSSLRRKLTER